MELELIKAKNELANEKARLNRIIRSLKIEYQDFKDAENMEMSIDLGENMREQLKNIFRILEKEEITF